jgi:hypothetical protein
MSDDFDWIDDDSIVIPPNDGVAVYANEKGAVVIRSRAGRGDYDDTFIVIPRPLAKAVADAILTELKRSK